MITEDLQKDVIYFLDKAQKSNEVLVNKFNNSDYYWSGSDLKMNFYELFQALFEKLKNLLLTLIQENTKLAILPDENKKKLNSLIPFRKTMKRWCKIARRKSRRALILAMKRA